MLSRKIKCTQDEIHNNALYAQPAGVDDISRQKEKFYTELEKVGLAADEEVSVQLGLRKSGKFGHRAVIIKLLNEEKLAFRLELEIHMADRKCGDVEMEDKRDDYICGDFICPDHDCRFETKSFLKYTKHHMIRHRMFDEELEHICCGETFKIFESYVKHLYMKHKNIKTVTLNFEQVRPEKFHSFLSPNRVTFVTTKTTTMGKIYQTAVDIILNFGSYWIFAWNCHDFAIWFLLNTGTPLASIDPAIPDYLTGSGTESSARYIQRRKHMSWYKSSPQLQKFDLVEFEGTAICNHPSCANLPPLPYDAFQHHIAFQHSAHPTQEDNADDKNEPSFWYDVMCGINSGLDLDIDIDRRWTLYKFRGRKLRSHVSLVFQPWESDYKLGNSPCGFCFIVDVIQHSSDFKLNMRETDFDAKLLKLGDIVISIRLLYVYLSAIYLTWKTYLDHNCEKFCNTTSNFLLDEVPLFNTQRLPHLKDQTAVHNTSGLVEYVESKILNKDQDSENYSSSHDNFPAKARIVTLLTSLKKNPKGLCALHPTLILFMMSFDTIGELFVPWFLLVFVAQFCSMDICQKKMSYVVTSSWYNQLLFLRKIVFLISISFLLLECALNFENFTSVYKCQFIWSQLLVLDFEIGLKFKYKSMCVGHITNVWKLLKLSCQQDIFRILIILSFSMPATYCLIGVTLISMYLLVSSRTSLMLTLFTNLGPDRRLGYTVLSQYFMGVIFCYYNGVIRQPVADLSNLHIIAMFIYTCIAWSVHQIKTARLHDDVIMISQEILMNDITPDSQYPESKFPFFHRLLQSINIVCKILHCLFPLSLFFMLVCFETHTSLYLLVLIIYIQFVMISFFMDVEQVVYCTAGGNGRLRYWKYLATVELNPSQRNIYHALQEHWSNLNELVDE